MPVLLDSNVVSELIRKARDPAVAKWVAGLPLEDLFFHGGGRSGVALWCYDPASRSPPAVAVGGHRGNAARRVWGPGAPIRQSSSTRVCGHGGGKTRGWPPDCTSRLSDRCDSPFTEHDGGDAQYSRLRGNRSRHRQSLDGDMNGTTEAFARVKIDKLLEDAGWNLTDGVSVLFEHALPNGTQSDYVWCERRARFTGFVESAINTVVGKRFGKRQQMRWSKPGRISCCRPGRAPSTARSERSSSSGIQDCRPATRQAKTSNSLPDCPRVFGTPVSFRKINGYC